MRRRLKEHALRCFADRGEIRFDVLHAAQHHADRNGDFRIDDVLPQQFFEQPAGDQRVIFRVAEKRRDPFEGFDEAGEIRIVVTRGDFFGGELHAVASGQLHGRFRADRTFQVQMQFGFGKGVEDRERLLRVSSFA